jgi:hypothetical protein
MNYFRHSGDFGDIIYSLPAVRALGGGILYITAAQFTRQQLDATQVSIIRPLLEAQPYIARVLAGSPFQLGYKHVYDLDEHRKFINRPHKRLASAYCVQHGLAVDICDSKWLTAKPRPQFPVIVNLTARYPNAKFPWRRVVEEYRGYIGFVGTLSEWTMFTVMVGEPIPFVETPTLLDVAEVIAGSQLFIGNQSAPYAIAEGLKHNTIQSVYLDHPDCIFKRPNAQYVLHGQVDLPKV